MPSLKPVLRGLFWCFGSCVVWFGLGMVVLYEITGLKLIDDIGAS